MGVEKIHCMKYCCKFTTNSIDELIEHVEKAGHDV